ncbi:MAG: hypothetical protein R6X12_00880, partial [bacterium]
MRGTTVLLAVLCVAAFAAGDAALPQTGTHQIPIDNRKAEVADGLDAVTIPRLMSYQGRLTDTLGVPVPDDNYSVVFRLYSQPSGGSAFWNETQSVTTEDGLFAVLLGTVTPIGSMPDAGAAYLTMAVEGSTELTPRLRIASAAYAYLTERAASADLLQGKDTTDFVRTGQANSVTSAMVVDGTIVRGDVATGFKAPFSDTADYARAAPAVDSARVAANSHRLQGKDTTALDGRFVNEGQANSVTSAMITDGAIATADIATGAVTSAKILDGTVVRADVAAGFKAPFSDTADYARAAPAVDSARVAANSHKLQGKDTTALDGRFVNEGQAGSVTSTMVLDNTLVRADVAAAFKAPYSDTSDYARAAPATDSARVAANAHLLQTRDTTYFARASHAHPFVDSSRVAVSSYDSRRLQGKDTSALDARFVNEAQSNAVATGMITDTAVTMVKLARAGAATGEVIKWDGSAWAPGPDNTGGGTGVTNVYQDTGITCVPNPITTTGNVRLNLSYTDARYVNEAQANSVTSAMIADGTIAAADIASSAVTEAKLASNAVTSAKILDGTIAAADLNQMGAGPGQVLKWTGTAWAPRNDSIGGGGGSGTVTSVGQATGVVCTPNPIVATGTVRLDTTYSDARYVNEGQASSVTSAMIVDGTIAAADIATGAVTSAKILDGTIARADVAVGFKAPFSDTADYARVAPTVDSARVAANSHRLQGKDTTALDGRFVNEGQASAVTSAMITDGAIAAADIATGAVTSAKILDGTIARADVAAGFKAPFSDTADYARAAPATDSARVAANAHLLQTRDTTYFARAAHTHPYVDSSRVAVTSYDSRLLQGKDTSALDARFVNELQADAIATGMLVDTAVTMVKLARAGAATGEVIKWDGSAWAPGPDNTGGGTGVTNVYQDTGITCVPNPITTTGNVRLNLSYTDARYVNEGQASSVTSAMILDGTIARADVAAGFKAPLADTADYARAAPATDSARVAGNAHLLQTKDTTYFAKSAHIHPYVDSAGVAVASYDSRQLQGKDTTGFVRTGQTNSVTSAMVVDGTIVRGDVATGFKAPFSDTADYARAAPAVDSARVAANSHRLQGKDTTALDARFVNEGQANSVTSAMITDGAIAAADIATGAVTSDKILDGTVVRADVAAGFKAP